MTCRICVHFYSDPEFISVDIYSMSNYKNFLLTWGAIDTFVCSLSPWHTNSLGLYSEVCLSLSAANFFAVSISLLINNANVKHYIFTTLVTRLHARLELKSCQCANIVEVLLYHNWTYFWGIILKFKHNIDLIATFHLKDFTSNVWRWIYNKSLSQCHNYHETM